eukprot:TRINITY_DN7849_c0_g1_i2.p1 TRINITY_DN7849_c0_g1~~TRINITY_DN7849_c0_g1_i2.p1  ORF type:complete len:203 (-),score=17.13 TRINITY_DN7849_c0_g1_i2:38-613(-)
MLLSIARLGNPVLRKVSAKMTPEEIRSPQIQSLATDMYKTYAHYGGRGLSANQVGVLKQIAFLDLKRNNDSDDKRFNKDVLVMFNPYYEAMLKHEVVAVWEYSLCIPGYVGLVKRFNHLLVHYYDEMGIKRTLGSQGVWSGYLQHQIDYLNGKLYIDCLLSREHFYAESEWEKICHYTQAYGEGDIYFLPK